MRKYNLNSSHCRDETTLSLCPRILIKLLLKLGLLGCLSGFSILFFTSKALAQQSNIIPDNTLGAESSRINRNVNVNGINADTIDKGARRGSNLFHSFSEFNINDGQNVYFANPAGVENILTRVTGGNASNIFGTLGVDGSANLFLINPSGIVFGENARLDVQGSFVGTTADSIKLKDGTFFSATNNQETPLLTISVPVGLQIGTNPGKITIKGDGHNLTYNPSTLGTIRGDIPALQVPTGKTLALVGGDIALEGGNLQADSGRIELGSVAEPGLVSLSANNSGFALGYSGIENFGDIQLSQKASVDASGEGGGSIQVQSRRLSLQDGSSILSITSGAKSGGDFTVNATESIELIGESADGNFASTLLTESQGAGTSGNLTISTGKLTTTDGAYLSTYITSSGNGGNLTVKATESVELSGRRRFSSGLFTGTSSGSSGNAGELKVETGNLTIKNSATMFTSSAGNGNGGNIFIQASDSISVSSDSNSSVNTRIVSGATNGTAGDIQLNTGTFSLTNRAFISSSIIEKGNGGNITINARDNVIFDTNSFAASIIGSDAVGKGGDIRVITGNLSLTNGSQLSTSVFGEGNAGNIFVEARNNVIFDTNSLANSIIFSGAVGKGGDIRVITGNLSLTNGSYFSTSVLGEGNAGNIFVEARDSVKLDGIVNNTISGIGSDLLTGGVGKGGDIQITTESLFVTNGADISAATDGQGNAGNITINARDKIIVDGFDTNLELPSSVFTSAAQNSVGNSGDIRITTGELLVTNGGGILTTNFGRGNGGNIFLNIRDTITFDGVISKLVPGSRSVAGTFAVNGNAGNIDVKTGSLFLTNGGSLAASATPEENSNNIANAGNITINARDTIKLDGTDSGLFTNLLRGVGKGGDIKITTGSLFLDNTGLLYTQTSGKGNAGNIKVNAADSISLSNSSRIVSAVGSGGEGKGGNIKLTANSFDLSNGSLISASTFGKGDAGDIKTNAADSVFLSNSSLIVSTVRPGGEGKGGNIKLTANSFDLSNGSLITASTFGKGDAGDIEINADDTITFSGRDNNGFSSGVLSRVEVNGVGNAGEVKLTTGSLSLENGGFISTETRGKGDAGDIKIDAADSVFLSNSSRIDSTVRPGGEGKGGEIDIDTQILTLTRGSQIAAAVTRQSSNLPSGKGKAGEININASDSVTLSGIGARGFSSGIITSTGRGTSGDAGDITITTNEFRITNGAIVTATTSNDDNAGDITINANTFAAINGGQILSNTNSSGNAGTINLNIIDNITLSGTNENSASGLFASTSANSTGEGGSIFIDPRLVTIENGARVSVSSDGTGDAGNITLQAGTLKLDNGIISAQTASTLGGNITLEIGELLLLRNGSQISTTAGTAQKGGDGGNITVNAKFIVAPANEDNNISANAFLGNGGKVLINSRGIFGIESRSQPTSKSDITASSQRGIAGETNVNTDDTSSIENSFTELSPNIDTDAIIANSCIVRGNQQQKNSFYITGSGALPPNRPGNSFVSNYITGEVRGVATKPRPWKKGDPIIEPQGLYRLNNGQLLLSRECSN